MAERKEKLIARVGSRDSFMADLCSWGGGGGVVITKLKHGKLEMKSDIINIATTPTPGSEW